MNRHVDDGRSAPGRSDERMWPGIGGRQSARANKIPGQARPCLRAAATMEKTNIISRRKRPRTRKKRVHIQKGRTDDFVSWYVKGDPWFVMQNLPN